ncbi:RNA-binding protein [Candidatus Peregrinibacteria bacterium CG08_land_8_20_14_0_20_41_10]|nr:MAG: hypothetical protein AUJ78_01530 [Candidatus Peregrinibacteria bacterium CG1_02_41_10]PIS32238.1 MAG: RNA-binding protein [Candidatus Peregrinibacteria bacterium CG08_land_8_20_14_0_20_41_10]
MVKNADADREFIEFVLKQVAEFPDKVVIEKKKDEQGILLTVQVAKEDMGRVVGKSGRTAQALRTLLRLIGSVNSGEKVNLKIIEPSGEEMAETKEE